MIRKERDNNFKQFNFTGLILPFYIPTAIVSIVLGMLMPILPLYSIMLGASITNASFVVGLYGLGNLAFSIPAGFLNSHFNKKSVLLAAILMASLAVGVSAVIEHAILLGICMFIFGACHVSFLVTQLSFFRTTVPSNVRGRSIALIGGWNRTGRLVGPVMGGLIAQVLGYSWAFLICSVLLGIGAAVMLLCLPSSYPKKIEANLKAHSLQRMKEIVQQNYKTFATAGVAMIILQLMRTARQVVIPLLGDSNGIPVSKIGLIFGILSAIELLLFYPTGLIMDKYGRKSTALPSLFLFSAGFLLFPFTESFAALTLAAAVTGIGNGLGSGLNMTLSTDFSPKENPGEFIGLWRFVVEFGTSGGPFIVGAIAGIFSLGSASVIVAGFGLTGVLIMYFLVPETLKKDKNGENK